jgi:photosystem II stability/assembly factor-like uncharacterized protein
VGDSGTVLTSANGINWSAQTSGTHSNLLNIAFVNGTFTAVGENGTILTSTNGVSWTQLPVMNAITLYSITPY